jgi:hypothetical protein
MNTMLSLVARVLQVVLPTIVLAVIARFSLRLLTLGRYPRRTRWLPEWDDIDVLEVIGAYRVSIGAVRGCVVRHSLTACYVQSGSAAVLHVTGATRV